MGRNTDSQPSWITCPTCGGSGYIMERRPVTRKGRTQEEMVSVDCKQCDTSGQVRK